MADFVPFLVCVTGIIALVKPEWIAAIDRRQRAAGTTRRSRDVEMSEGYLAFVRLVGGVLALVGAALFVASLS